MKKSGILISLLFGAMALTSCEKSNGDTPQISPSTAPSIVSAEVPTEKPAETKAEMPIETSKEKTPKENTDEKPTVPPKAPTSAKNTIKTVNLRNAEPFALLAHESISSIPNSSITGKVGIRPGGKTMLGITPEEISGGFPEVFVGDDLDAAKVNFVTQAKIDLINAYNDLERRTPDSDKIDLFAGSLGNKTLSAGIYKWNSRVTIPNDLTLEGDENDIFIFQVMGDLRVGSDVTIKLVGGIQPKNIFWQVGDNVLLKTKSAMVGTIISQLTFEMRDQAGLTGRAFSKNANIILDKNIITKP